VAQRILVLGASGYIGQHLVQALSEQGYPVLAAARHVDRLQKLNLPGVSCHPLDLNQPQGFPPCWRRWIPFIIWCTGWVKAAILLRTNAGSRSTFAMPCASRRSGS
jgi:nucleoside-diphosphate-sugar epimerase